MNDLRADCCGKFRSNGYLRLWSHAKQQEDSFLFLSVGMFQSSDACYPRAIVSVHAGRARFSVHRAGGRGLVPLDEEKEQVMLNNLEYYEARINACKKAGAYNRETEERQRRLLAKIVLHVACWIAFCASLSAMLAAYYTYCT